MAKKEVKEKKKNKESFFKQVRKEMKNVIWPNKKDVIKYSVATVFMSGFLILFFLLVNLISSIIKGLFI